MRKKAKRGFTLIELIISLAMLGIIGVFLASFIAPQLKIYQASQEQTRAQAACASVMNLVRKELHYAKDIELSGNIIRYTLVGKEGEETGKVLDGNTLATSYYSDYATEGKKIVLTFEQQNSFIQLTCSVLNEEDKEIYTATQTIDCVNEALQP